MTSMQNDVSQAAQHVKLDAMRFAQADSSRLEPNSGKSSQTNMELTQQALTTEIQTCSLSASMCIIMKQLVEDMYLGLF